MPLVELITLKHQQHAFLKCIALCSEIECSSYDGCVTDGCHIIANSSSAANN